MPPYNCAVTRRTPSSRRLHKAASAAPPSARVTAGVSQNGMEDQMAPNRRPRLRLAAVVGLSAAAIIGQSARADRAANVPPKVEFVEVKGHQCLQPIVSAADAQLSDYRAAEARWLATNYPGVPTPEAKTEILLSPATDGGREPRSTTVQRETFYLEGIVGEGAVACFELNLATIPGQSHE